MQTGQEVAIKQVRLKNVKEVRAAVEVCCQPAGAVAQSESHMLLMAFTSGG